MYQQHYSFSFSYQYLSQRQAVEPHERHVFLVPTMFGSRKSPNTENLQTLSLKQFRGHPDSAMSKQMVALAVAGILDSFFFFTNSLDLLCLIYISAPAGRPSLVISHMALSPTPDTLSISILTNFHPLHPRLELLS
jgi:hypothetical protein